MDVEKHMMCEYIYFSAYDFERMTYVNCKDTETEQEQYTH